MEKGPPLSSMEHSGRVQEAREKLLAVARERLQSIEKAASKRQPQDPRPQADSESSGLPSPLSQCSSSLPSPMSSPRKEGIVEGNVASRDIGLRRPPTTPLPHSQVIATGGMHLNTQDPRPSCI